MSTRSSTPSIPISCISKGLIIGMLLFPATLPATSGWAGDSSVLLQFMGKEYTPVFSLLPNSLPIEESFRPSTHQPFAGTVASLSGKAYVYHKNEDMIYTIKKDNPVFNGDTLVTGEKSRVVLEMSDESILTLTSQTKLTIDKSLPRMKVRDTALQLFFGRVRALVKKLAGEYTVRTPTGSIGVRGTDFAVAVAPVPLNRTQGGGKNLPIGFLTAVLTGDHQSTVELAGSRGPSVLITPLSASGVRTGGKAEPPVYVGAAALTLLNKISAEPGATPTQKRPALPPPSLPKISMQSGKVPALPKISLNIRKQPAAPKKSAPKSVPKYAPASGPCWPLDSTPNKGLQYFRVCK